MSLTIRYPPSRSRWLPLGEASQGSDPVPPRASRTLTTTLQASEQSSPLTAATRRSCPAVIASPSGAGRPLPPPQTMTCPVGVTHAARVCWGFTARPNTLRTGARSFPSAPCTSTYGVPPFAVCHTRDPSSSTTKAFTGWRVPTAEVLPSGSCRTPPATYSTPGAAPAGRWDTWRMPLAGRRLGVLEGSGEPVGVDTLADGRPVASSLVPCAPQAWSAVGRITATTAPVTNGMRDRGGVGMVKLLVVLGVKGGRGCVWGGSVADYGVAGGEDVGAVHVVPGHGRHGVLHRAVGGEAHERPLAVLEDPGDHVGVVLPLGVVRDGGLVTGVRAPLEQLGALHVPHRDRGRAETVVVRREAEQGRGVGGEGLQGRLAGGEPLELATAEQVGARAEVRDPRQPDRQAPRHVGHGDEAAVGVRLRAVVGDLVGLLALLVVGGTVDVD